MLVKQTFTISTVKLFLTIAVNNKQQSNNDEAKSYAKSLGLY